MKKKTYAKLSIAIGLLAAFGITGCAPVTVSSTPPGANVYTKNKNKLIGTTPVKVNLVVRDKELVVRKDGYFSKSVVLSTIDPVSTTVELRRRERVLLVTEPAGADLYVDGVGRVGKTPYKIDYTQPYRTFQVKVPGYASRSVTIPEDPESNVVIKLDREETVTLVTRPKNAVIFDEDGNNLGTTPLAVAAGVPHAYAIRKDGYYAQDITVDSETENPVVVELKREPVVTVYSEPAGACIVYKGVELGQTPFRQLVKEDMDIVIRSDRYYDKQITLTPDAPKTVNVSLEPMPYVTIESQPAGATLYLSGGVELVGVTPIEVLIEKDTAFEMHKNGYDIKQFLLSPDSRSDVTVPLVESLAASEKTVHIDSEPTGAEVYRPGGAELIGKTPFEQRVRGERTFELHLDGYETKIVTVATDSADSVVFALAKDESARNVTVSDPLLNTPSSF